jgi:hypothetical protein
VFPAVGSGCVIGASRGGHTLAPPSMLLDPAPAHVPVARRAALVPACLGLALLAGDPVPGVVSSVEWPRISWAAREQTTRGIVCDVDLR